MKKMEPEVYEVLAKSWLHYESNVDLPNTSPKDMNDRASSTRKQGGERKTGRG